MLSDLVNGHFSPTSCVPLHGTLAGRLRALELSHGLQLGRYLHQNLDVGLARVSNAELQPSHLALP